MTYDPSSPTVPAIDGVPTLANGTTATTGTALTGDNITVTANKATWGIYLASDNSLAVSPDAFISVEYDAEYRQSDFPLEDGGFETYNKVATPFETRVIVSKGGDENDRRDFIRAIEALRGDTNLYNVVTPEFTYLKVNFSRVSLARTREKGGGLITYELVLREIRSGPVTENSNTKTPAGAAVTNNGTTQAAPASTALEQTVAQKAQASVSNGAPKAAFYSLQSGQKLQQIALVANQAKQALSVPLGSAVAGIVLSQKSTGLFVDISLAGTIIAANVPVRDSVPLINNSYAGFPGDLAIVDTQGASKPDYTGLGSRYQMVWAQPA